MVVVLEAVSGPITGRRIEVREGSIVRFGRTTRSDYPIAEDSYLSSLHFSVECDGVQCRVRDMGSSNGTFVNGNRITEQLVKHGDSLAAGETAFTIHLEEAAPPPIPEVRSHTAVTPVYNAPPGLSMRTAAVTVPIQVPITPPAGMPAPAPAAYTRGQLNLLNALFPPPPPGMPQPGAYAILDAIRDSRIPAFLDASGERYMPLDPSGRLPVFVVAPVPQGRLLDVLVKDGWGRGWGFFCISAYSMEEICTHLRNYLTMYNGAGRPMTFRFWDPRVLRALAPALPPEEAADFFGPISRIVVEGETPEVAMELALTPRGPRQQTLMLV